MKRGISFALAVGLGSLALGACSKDASNGQAAEAEADIGITASNVRLVLPVVKGNPGVVYFEVINNVRDYAVLRKVEVAGAGETMLHNTRDNNGVSEMVNLPPVNLPLKETITFEPGGKHVMVMEVGETLQAGGTTEITFTFAGGDKLSVLAPIEAMGKAN